MISASGVLKLFNFCPDLLDLILNRRNFVGIIHLAFGTSELLPQFFLPFAQHFQAFFGFLFHRATRAVFVRLPAFQALPFKSHNGSTEPL